MGKGFLLLIVAIAVLASVVMAKRVETLMVAMRDGGKSTLC